MKGIVAKDYEAMSRAAADQAEALVSFPGGDTPVGLLRKFCRRVKDGTVAPW